MDTATGSGDTPSSPKIKDLDALAAELAALRAKGKRIVHCHGVFDLLHVGHIRHFQKAREFGDVLVVTITPDQWVNKGPHRPAFAHHLRAEVLANLSCIDYVAVNRWPIALETIRLVKPDFYVKGSEYRDAEKDVTGGITLERQAAESVGGKLVFTDEIVFSSSNLINRHMSSLPREASDYLADFTKTHPLDTVLGYLENARKLKVLVIGETIIDDYHYCEALGKSGKEPILAVRYVSSEKFAGGIIAVANHVASFCDNVSVASYLGNLDPQEEFVREKLSPKVKPYFQYMEKAPTIVKRRFIENYPFQKMFEVYLMNDDAGERANTRALVSFLDQRLPEFDLVIVADYGHGMLMPEAIETLSAKARCLAVNTQANAANHGFNTISKYPRVDYACVSENELRLEARQRHTDVRQIIERTSAKVGCRQMMITRGRNGLLCYDREQGFSTSPALAGQFTDRVGAGDAVFAVTSLCMAQKAPPPILGLVGNAVGALAVAIIGNRSAVDRTGLLRFLTSVLK